MSIIGCDLHTRFQVIAYWRRTTGEIVTRRLEHENGEARKFYAGLGERREWGSRRRDARNGSSGCWRNWGTSCG